MSQATYWYHIQEQDATWLKLILIVCGIQKTVMDFSALM